MHWVTFRPSYCHNDMDLCDHSTGGVSNIAMSMISVVSHSITDTLSYLMGPARPAIVTITLTSVTTLLGHVLAVDTTLLVTTVRGVLMDIMEMLHSGSAKVLYCLTIVRGAGSTRNGG